MFRKFIVTREVEPDLAVNIVDAETSHRQQTPKAKYATRGLFIMLLVTGAILISTGISLLVTCRSEVTEHTCGMTLDTEPCSNLAVSAYFGCALLLATILGFGCVGRKAMAVLLIPIIIGEAAFGVYILVTGTLPIDAMVAREITSDEGKCEISVDGVSENDNNYNMKCWNAIAEQYFSCQHLKDYLPMLCMPSEEDRQKCGQDIGQSVSEIVWYKLLVIGPLLILHAPLHLVFAVCLWILRKSDSLNRETKIIPHPAHPKKIKFSVQKKSAKLGTSDHDQSNQSLILYPDGNIVNMQKYVFKKLRRQKNTYATV